MAISRTGKLNKRLEFLVKKKVGVGPNGTDKFDYAPEFKSWFAYKQKLISQIVEENGGTLENTQTIIVRQAQKKPPQLDWRVRINGVDYDIVKLNPDIESDGFLIIFIKAVK
ncbi:head-tail adaptor protein [Enterococcus sp. S86.2]|uniref:phage head completion protein n=1 Tax=Enterococcus sp. S86.2 TaxID=3031299 RepID=UPI0026F2881B|nr:head-tail adaptor protein [Enterococcus sp. S86.2]